MTCCDDPELEWSDEATSHICTSCGSLADPSQSVFSIPEYNVNALGQTAYNPWDQSKESRDGKQLATITEFISSLCTSLSCSSVEERTSNLFIQVKNAPIPKFTWGRRAKIIAAACLYIALREAKVPCSLYDLSNIMSEEKMSPLVRCIFEVSATLKLPFVPSDPSIHLPEILTYLSETLEKHPQTLPESLTKPMKASTFSLRQVSNRAEAITGLLARHGADHPLSGLPTPPTAVACFLLAIEGELRVPLLNLGVLAEYLGKRLQVGKSAVMKRYKIVQDELSSCMERIPWLKTYDARENGKRVKAGMGRRALVAKGLQDILRFQEEVWKDQLKAAGATSSSRNEEFSSPGSLPVETAQSDEVAPPRAKRRKKNHDKENRPMDEATRFLINPLEAHIPTTNRKDTSYPDNCMHIPTNTINNHNSTLPGPPLLLPRGPEGDELTIAPPKKRTRQIPLAFASYLLTAPTSCSSSASDSDLSAFIFESMKKPPTRLQLLTAQYGSAEAVPDDELFDDGEWEGMLRDEQEMCKIEQLMREKGDWMSDAEDEEEESEAVPAVKAHTGRKRKVRDGDGLPSPQKKSRINLNALASFMQRDADGDDWAGDSEEERERLGDYNTMLIGLQNFDSRSQSEDGFGLSGFTEDEDDEGTRSSRTPFSTDGEVVIDDWRPASPVGGDGNWDEEWY